MATLTRFDIRCGKAAAVSIVRTLLPNRSLKPLDLDQLAKDAANGMSRRVWFRRLRDGFVAALFAWLGLQELFLAEPAFGQEDRQLCDYMKAAHCQSEATVTLLEQLGVGIAIGFLLSLGAVPALEAALVKLGMEEAAAAALVEGAHHLYTIGSDVHKLLEVAQFQDASNNCVGEQACHRQGVTCLPLSETGYGLCCPQGQIVCSAVCTPSKQCCNGMPLMDGQICCGGNAFNPNVGVPCSSDQCCNGTCMAPDQQCCQAHDAHFDWVCQKVQTCCHQSCCSGEEVCTDLGCKPCPSGQHPCSGLCVPLGTDQNCAGCGDTCPSGQHCENGHCIGSVCTSGGVCGTFANCPGNPNPNCYCATTTEGTTACMLNAPCSDSTGCSSSANCPAGFLCIRDTCCGGSWCVRECGAGTAAVASAVRARVGGPTFFHH